MPAALMSARHAARFARCRRGLATLLGLLLAGAAMATSSAAAPDDPKLTLIDDPGGADFGPQFSPDSRRLVFERRALMGGQVQAYTAPVQGGSATPLSSTALPVEQTRLRWSPVTRQIAFTGIGPQNTVSTWLMDADGTHAHPAYAADGSHAYYPSWYPDGARLLELDADQQALRIVTLASGHKQPLSITPALLTGMASVSPDGHTIAVAAQRKLGQPYNQTHNQIWLVAEDGSAHPLVTDAMEGRAPSWSPDGKRLLFESNHGSPVSMLYAIFVADRDGSHLQRLTPFTWNAQHPVWSPDGRWIAFAAVQFKGSLRQGMGIVVMPAPAS